MVKTAVLALCQSLYVLKSHHPQLVANWLGTNLARENYPSSLVTLEEKKKFVEQALQAKNKGLLTNAMLDFLQNCRGWKTNIIDLSD